MSPEERDRITALEVQHHELNKKLDDISKQLSDLVAAANMEIGRAHV